MRSEGCSGLSGSMFPMDLQGAAQPTWIWGAGIPLLFGICLNTPQQSPESRIPSARGYTQPAPGANTEEPPPRGGPASRGIPFFSMHKGTLLLKAHLRQVLVKSWAVPGGFP